MRRGQLSTRARRALARAVAALGPARGSGQRTTFHHTAVVVSDLERSIEFYARHFGGRVEYVVRDIDDRRVAELLELSEVQLSLAFVAFGDAHLELLEFSVPANGRRFDAHANDFGTTHISFEVADVHALYAGLIAEGGEVARPPYTVDGRVLLFCFDPDGNRIELIQPRADTSRITRRLRRAINLLRGSRR